MRGGLSFILVSISLLTIAQYRFDHLSTKDGLTQNSINDIYQDGEGFIWLASQDGLNRFDGYEFTKYNREGEMDMAENFLWSIVEDQHGNIWTASPGGATRLNWKEGSSTHFLISNDEEFRGEKNQVIRVLPVEDRVVVSFGPESFIIDPLEFMDSASVVLSKEYAFAVNGAGAGGMLNALEVSKARFFIFPEHIVSGDTILFPKGYSATRFNSEALEWGDGFFLGTKNGLLYYNLTSRTFEKIGCVDVSVYDILLESERKELWVSTDQGIMILDPEKKTCIRHIQSDDGDHDLTSNVVSALYKTNDGLIWAGTANGGVNIYDPEKDRFKFLGAKNGLSDKAVWSMYQTRDHLLTGTDNGLYISRLNGKLCDHLFASMALASTKKMSHPHFGNKRITAIEKLDDSKFLIGTFEEEIILLDINTGESKLIKLDEHDNPHIVSAIKVAGDNVWVTTHNGIFAFSKDLRLKKYISNYDTPDEIISNYHLAAYVTSDGMLWVGSNVGFYTISPTWELRHFPYNQNQPESGPAFNFVSGFFEDHKGRIWISTFGGGVSCYDRKNNEFFHLNSKDGLSSDICSAILGNENEVFVSSNGGLSRVDLESLEITNYTAADGLINNEFAIASSFQFEDNFLFGNVNGLVAFNPEEMNEQEEVFSPSITGLTSNYIESEYSRIQDDKLELFPGDRIFSLEFSNMSFRKKDQVAYQYSLSGFNDEWVNTTSAERRATYSLSPGTYQFNVRTVSDGRESETETLEIVVHPAFYQTWWFYLLSGFTLVIGIVAASRYYSHQQLKEKLRKLELQQKIQNERERISRDLHDNVGSQITYIATSINNLSGSGSPDELRELGEFTRDTMRQLRETIWVINNDEVTPEELKTKVLDYASEILKPYPNVIHEVAFEASDQKLNPSTAINIFRLIQEAINNAVKHASPSKINIRFKLANSASLVIEDDGSGFDGSDKVGHFGLLNMRKRAKDLGAEFNLISSPGNGTRIELTNLKIGQMT